MFAPPPIAVTVRDQTSTGKETACTVLRGLTSPTTVRDLIRTRVREEVANYNADSHPRFRGLVAPEGAELATDGAGWVLARDRRIDWERQADVAIEAFERNGFFLLVDGRQATDLDEELVLTADMDMRFVRLIALVGG